MTLITTSNSLRKAHRIKGWVLNLDNLRERIKELGVSERWLERKIGMGQGTVNAWLNGRQQPSMASYLKLCDALKVQP